MYALRNRVLLIGYLGQEPDVRLTEKGKKYARFSIATHDTYRGANGEKVNETYWHNVVAWGKLAEIAEQFLNKGKEVAVEGKLVHRNYTDKNGVKRSATEVQVYEILLLGPKRA